MNIIAQNLLSLLRSGAFDEPVCIEPMSAWKWQQLYKLACLHGTVTTAYQGIQRCQTQFFLQIPESQMEIWRKAAMMPNSAMIEDIRMTNPVLNQRLKAIEEEEAPQSPMPSLSLQLLHQLLLTSQNILNRGICLRHLVDLGMLIKANKKEIDTHKIQEWAADLKLEPMMRLIATLLVQLLGIQPEELPFHAVLLTTLPPHVIDDLLVLRSANDQWHVQQGGNNIFIHTENSTAILWQVRHSARYFRYYPAESTTNFFVSFIRTLSQIEE